MRFQLWRMTKKGTSKVPPIYNLLGTVSSVGKPVTEKPCKYSPGGELPGSMLFHTSAATPIVPGDLLCASKTDYLYKVMSVSLDPMAGVYDKAKAKAEWEISARTVHTFEPRSLQKVSGKHRDYQQCSSRRKKDADPST